MNREEQLERWLNGTLSAEEKAAFENLPEFQTLQKITQALEAYRAPEYATQEEFVRLQQAKLSRPAGKSATLWLKPILRIAAILVLVAGAYFIFFSNRSTTVTALVAERKEVNLPDQSEVMLNAASAITYSGSSWKEKRVVELTGEAFFKVARGSRFDVKTIGGVVTVLGTQFNVKSRDNYFEVICYEGSVQVTAGNYRTQLSPGSMARLINNQWTIEHNAPDTIPGWMKNQTTFESLPYQHVLAEFERQYNVTIVTRHIDEQQLFTGTFVLNDMELALKAITIPVGVTYTIRADKKTVVLSGEGN
ncbi:MAG: FecR domain-containing protein [Cyclobacteriaceae bacterium]|nr:FecR domain-containing protein [Cyclobacteriaceae bacterium]